MFHICTDLASKCDIVFSSLLADAALQAVFSSYLSGKPKKGSVFIDASTVFPDLTEKLALTAEEAGVHYLACPVFGRPDAALAGKSLVVAAGHPEAKAKVLDQQGCDSSNRNSSKFAERCLRT